MARMAKGPPTCLAKATALSVVLLDFPPSSSAITRVPAITPPSLPS
jgi:hypothetical protein